MSEVGRVLVAFDDDPLEPSPTWRRLDAPDGTFPDQFVSGWDATNGKQTLLDRTDTGTATVYINDHVAGLFDPRNSSSPFYGDFTGKQLLLQLYDPTRDIWEPQFRGNINGISYEIDGSAVNALGQPINASLQVNAVDVMDYFAGFGLTPGLAGVAPAHVPAGGENGVWYAETAGTVDDRIIEILTDSTNADWVAARAVIFSGNVSVQAVKYDPDTPALTALRDACDAEIPFIANLLVDRFGRLCFRGRYARWDPDGVSEDANASEPGRWPFHRWFAGDGAAIALDSSRVQLRQLTYDKSRDNVINVAVCYPANMPPAQMPNQVYAAVDSIDQYGHHAAPPMSDLLTGKPIFDRLNGHPTWTRYDECFHFARLLVENQKFARELVTAINFKTLDPRDGRAAALWPFLSQVDVSDIVNIATGYPGGIGLDGGSPRDDYFVEGRNIRVRPLQPDYDYVELDLQVSPFSWSADTHGVFPTRPAGVF